MEARRFRRSNVPLRVLLLGALVLMLAGCTVLPTMGQEEPTPTPVPAPPIPDKPTYVVQRGVVEQTLKFSGRVGPALEHELFFRQDGRIARVYVQNDDEVAQGQLLAELDNTDLYQQIEQVELDLSAARSALAAAQADIDYARQRAAIALDIQRLNLQKLEAHSDTADLTIARANLQSAEAERKAAQRAYDDRAAQPGAEASGQALALERATINYTIVKANYDKVLAARAQREIGLEIERQRLALSELEYGHLATEVDPSLAKAITRSELSLARLQGQYNTTIITATIAGRVTSLAAYEGRTAKAYDPLVVVSDDSTLEISADPSSTQKEQLTEGMAVSIELPSFPGQTYEGTIVKLPYPYGSGGGGNVEDPDTRTHIALTSAGVTLRAGDLVRLTVTLERHEDVLWLPPAAIQRFSGGRFVLVDEGGRQRPIDVRLGLESADRVEIVEGLVDGQVVVGQ